MQEMFPESLRQMRVFVALACLAEASHGRRVSSYTVEERRAPHSLEALLLSVMPFQNAFSSPASTPQKVDSASTLVKLPGFATEIKKAIEDLYAKREEWNRKINSEEADRIKVQEHISALTARLQELDESLEQSTWRRNEYDKTIDVTEAAYKQIVKSSHDLVNMLKREKMNLSSKKNAPRQDAPSRTESVASKLESVLPFAVPSQGQKVQEKVR
jgi:septal ring factor EnvC (AmiA/AmiB activator)